MKHHVIILYLILTSVFCDLSYSQLNTEPDIALVYPQLTKEVLYKNDNSFRPTDSWEIFFLSNHIKYEMLNDNALSGIDHNIKVVIIPEMMVVEEGMMEEIKQILDEGKGVLITGNFAQYDEDGYKLNPNDNKITGFRILQLKGTDALSVNQSLNGNTPLTVGLKPGQKMLLDKKSDLFFASNLSQDCNPLGSYILPDGGFYGVVINSAFNKKLLWFGFNFDQIIGKFRDRILLNSISWLSSAKAFINDWPGNFSSAGLIYKTIEKSTDFINTSGINIGSGKINYFISPQIFEKSGYNLKDLKDPGNINILWDDFFFSTLNQYEKSDWLANMKSLMNLYGDQKFCGISAFGEFYDSSTYNLLKEAGYSFIFSSGYSDSFSLNYDSTDNLYQFTQTYAPGTDLESRLNYVIKSNGIFYVNMDSIQDNISNLLTNKRCWLTSFSELLEWEKKLGYLELKTDFTGNENFEIIIKNNGPSSIENTGIWIAVPDITKNMIIENSWSAGKLTFDADKKMYFLQVYSIGGFQEISFRISAAM